MNKGRISAAVCLALLLAGVSSCEQLFYLELTSNSRVEVPSEGGEGVITFNTNALWDASADCSWCTLGDAVTDGTTVTLPYTCAPSGEYEMRSCTVTVEGLYNSFTVSIAQKAATGVLVDSDNVSVGYEETVIAIPTRANVSYTVNIPSDCDWITHVRTKALREAEEQFRISRNVSMSPREAVISFVYETGTTQVTVSQEGCEHFIIEESSEGLYGIEGEQFIYTPGEDQRQVVRRSGTFDYRILRASVPLVVELSGIPSELEEGMEFTGGVSLIGPGGLLFSSDFTMAVMRLQDDMLWLAMGEDAGAIIKY